MSVGRSLLFCVVIILGAGALLLALSWPVTTCNEYMNGSVKCSTVHIELVYAILFGICGTTLLSSPLVYKMYANDHSN